MKKQLLLTLLLGMIANASFASFYNGNWRWRNNDGNETTATWREAQNTAIEIATTSEILRLRIEVAVNDDANVGNATIQWSPDGTSGWTNLNTSTIVNPFAIATTNSFLVKDEETTRQLTTAFLGHTFTQGTVIYDRADIAFTLDATNRVYEYEIVLIPTANIEAGKTYYFRVYNSDYSAGTLALPSITTPVTLPIKLKSLTVKTSTEGNRIAWSTASEINNEYFSLERSNNGVTWVSIAKIDGSGKINSQSNYSFLDTNPLTGINYYRLTQHDADGKISYAGIASAVFDLRSGEPTVYPNPFIDQLNVNLTGYSGKTFEARLTNVQGQVVFQNQLTANESGIKIQLAQTQKSGVYILSINGNGVNLVKKVSVK